MIQLPFIFIILFGSSIYGHTIETFDVQCGSENIVRGSIPPGRKSWELESTKSQFLQNAFPWSHSPERGHQVNFGLKRMNVPTEDSNKFFFQMGLEIAETDKKKSLGNVYLHQSKEFFNCFIDRSNKTFCKSGAQNPRCCYDNEHSSIQKVLSSVYKSCNTENCITLQQSSTLTKYRESTYSCSALCHSDLIMQVEFEYNRKSNMTSVALSVITHRLSLIQRDGRFIEIGQDFGDSGYYQLKTELLISSVDDQSITSFWVNWHPPDGKDSIGPILEFGKGDTKTPFLIHRLDQFCFDCVSQDQHGWLGIDVQAPKMKTVFRPTLWSVDAEEGASFRLYQNCQNVVHTEESQAINYYIIALCIGLGVVLLLLIILICVCIAWRASRKEVGPSNVDESEEAPSVTVGSEVEDDYVQTY